MCFFQKLYRFNSIFLSIYSCMVLSSFNTLAYFDELHSPFKRWPLRGLTSVHRKKSLQFVTFNRRFWLKFNYRVYKRISLSFSNGLLYITPKKKPIFGLHLRLFFLCGSPVQKSRCLVVVIFSFCCIYWGFCWNSC